MKRISIQNVCVILLVMLGATATQAGAEVFTVDSNGGGNYTSIQDAVDNAHIGDTIIVNPGVYNENVKVDKGLTILSNPSLLSNGTDRTYVIGAVSENDVFDVSSNNVRIDGFYIIGGHSGVEREEVGINLDGMENCSVSGNALVLNDIGISLNGSKSNYLDNNLVSLGYKGITLFDSDGNVLYNNTVTTNSDGISLNNSMNNTFIDNVADSNLRGIFLGMSQGNMFNNNTIMRNVYGIEGRAAKSNFMVNNSLYLNDVGIKLNGSSENSIYENKFSDFLDVVDDGKNIWNSSSQGNLWHNYTGLDADRNGIGDIPYAINQTTNSIDYMPIFSLNPENVSDNVSENMSGNASENMSGST